MTQPNHGLPEAVAWMLCRKRDGFIRGCSSTPPSSESLEIAEIDGEEYRPLYTAAQMIAYAERCVGEAGRDAERLSWALLTGLFTTADKWRHFDTDAPTIDQLRAWVDTARANDGKGDG